MSELPAASSSDLRAQLSGGTGAEARTDLRQALGLQSDSEDRALARALVREISRQEVGRIGVADPTRPSEAQQSDPSRVVHGRASHYLVRLTRGGDDKGLDIGHLNDLRTLLAVVRGGTLRQRRAATLRLGELLSGSGRKPGDQVREAIETLVHLRKFDIAYELSSICSQLPGADGRRARNGRKEWERLADEVAKQVGMFWAGRHPDEPIRSLHGDQRAQLFARTRDLPDVIIGHLSAIIEGSAGVAELPARQGLIAALQNAADPRLLPALRSAVLDAEQAVAIPAIRALARIEDPRAHATLRRAWDRSVVADQRLVAAGGLGLVGDARGAEYVREVVRSEDPQLLPLALEALDSLGSSDDVQRVTELLTHDDSTVALRAVKTLGRIGDGRALLPLAHLRQSAKRSSLRAEIEEAEAAVLARMELLGEEPPSTSTVTDGFDTTKVAAMVKTRDPARVRLRARLSLWMGNLWLFVGAWANAIARFEMAAALRPGWVTPVLQVALTQARHQQVAQALASFRRAIELDRERVESHHTAVRHLAQTFLRRAETVERDGRLDIAFGLLEEVLALDLRKAPSGLRFALNQRHEALRTRRS